MEILETRALQQGWDDSLFKIQQNGQDLSVMTNYGTITNASVTTKVNSYAFTLTRAAQDSANLYACLKGSLEPAALKQLLSEKAKYTLTRSGVPGAPPGTATDITYNGLTFLWRIVQKSTAQTNATLGVIVHYLTNLKEVMSEVDSDISKFNTNINTKLSSYYANKQAQFDSQVLLDQLFEAYGMVSDGEFRKYIMRKNDEHDEGTTVLTPEALMDLAFKKYQTRDTKKIWKAKSKQEQEIVHLSAQLAKSDTKFNDRFRKFKSANKTKKPFSKTANKSDKNGFAAERKERYDKAPAWMKKNPQDGPKTMKKEGDTFHWCAHHKLWQKHKTDECRMGKGTKPPVHAKAKPVDRQPVPTNDDKLVLDDNLAQLAYADEIDGQEW
jgi:hypothetical protein